MAAAVGALEGGTVTITVTVGISGAGDGTADASAAVKAKRRNFMMRLEIRPVPAGDTSENVLNECGVEEM